MEKTAKTAFFILLLLLVPLSRLCAADPEWINTPHYEKDGIEMLMEGTAVINTGQGWETYNFAFQPYMQLDTTHITAYTGIQLTSGMYDWAVGATYWPLIQNRIKAGISANYNMNYYDNISLTHNVMLGGSIDARPSSWLGIKSSLFVMAKARSVFAIDTYDKFLHSITLAFNVEADIYLPYGITAYASLASYERYRYMLAIAPSFTFGVSKQLPRNFYAGLEAAARYTDFFTGSAFYDGCEIRIFAGRRF